MGDVIRWGAVLAGALLVGGRDRVLCGSGRDTVIADQRDRLRGCERVLR